MICPFCSNKTKIYNSRSTQNSTQTWRRHRCEKCTRTFTTKERIDWTGSIRIGSTDGESAYSRERLLLSIAKASNNLALPSGAISDLTDTIERQLQISGFFKVEIQKSEVITHTATTIIYRYDPNLALQYVNQIYRNNPPLELIKSMLGT